VPSRVAGARCVPWICAKGTVLSTSAGYARALHMRFVGGLRHEGPGAACQPRPVLDLTGWRRCAAHRPLGRSRYQGSDARRHMWAACAVTTKWIVGISGGQPFTRADVERAADEVGRVAAKISFVTPAGGRSSLGSGPADAVLERLARCRSHDEAPSCREQWLLLEGPVCGWDR
jgi:hypothetical protein